MAITAQDTDGCTGHTRYTYRLRLSATAQAGLLGEWGRCRWVWNECVAKSRQAHVRNRALPEGAEQATCGPGQLDRMLTEARAATVWLREGSSVPQQQIIRDFAKSRAKALKDVKARLPMRQRAGMPSTHCRWDCAPIPAPRAEPCPPGTRTPLT